MTSDLPGCSPGQDASQVSHGKVGQHEVGHREPQGACNFGGGDTAAEQKSGADRQGELHGVTRRELGSHEGSRQGAERVGKERGKGNERA